MDPLGLRGAYDSIRSSNGTAQHLLLAVWGVVAAGGFYAIGISNYHLAFWVAASVFVFYCTIWSKKTCLLWALRVDVVITAVVLIEYLLIAWSNGIPTAVFFLGRLAAGVILLLHGFYLADLVHRQILEYRKFESIVKSGAGQ